MSHTLHAVFAASHAGSANAPHFKRLAVQHCHGLIAQIDKAEQCRPGITNGALEHAKAAMAALTGQPSQQSRTPIQWPPLVRDEEE